MNNKRAAMRKARLKMIPVTMFQEIRKTMVLELSSN